MHLSGPAQAYFLISTITMLAGMAAYSAMWTLPYVQSRLSDNGGGFVNSALMP